MPNPGKLTRFCQKCDCFHSLWGKHHGKALPRIINTFEEYLTYRLEVLSDNARQDFQINLQKFEMFKALYRADFEQERGNYALADEIRNELVAVLESHSSHSRPLALRSKRLRAETVSV